MRYSYNSRATFQLIESDAGVSAIAEPLVLHVSSIGYIIVVLGLGLPMGWVGSTIARVLKFKRIMFNAFTARLDKFNMYNDQ